MEIMTKYCPSCSKKQKEEFKYCTDCGEKLQKAPAMCVFCGHKLGDFFKFCPECGNYIAEGKKPKADTKSKSSYIKTKDKNKLSLPKFNFKRIPKNLMIILLIVVVVVIVISAAYILLSSNPSSSGSEYGGRTFTVTIVNNYNYDVICDLKVGPLKYSEGFPVLAGESLPLTVNEDDLFSTSSSYNMTLYVMYDEIEQSATAIEVTSYASFEISESGNQHVVEATEYQ